MTLREACTKGAEILAQKGILEADLDAWYLLEHVTGISRALYFSDGAKSLEEEQEAEYFALIERRGQRIPLQHLTGVQEFMGLPFQVNEHVLIPRQDTEILVEEALSILQREQGMLSLLDMCTGSGCILLSILKLLNHKRSLLPVKTAACQEGSGDAGPIAGGCSANGISVCGTGVDLSGRALETAAGNAELLGVEAEFYQSDLFENVKGCFSMIVSNPPYIRTSEIETLQEEVKRHDPLMALDGGADGLYFYRNIIRDSTGYLLPGGYLLLETGQDQASDVAGLMRKAGFQRISVKKDLAGLDRVVSGVYDKKV